MISGNNHFNGFFHIRLGCKLSAGTDSPQCRFIDDVGKLSTGGTGCHSGYSSEIHIIGNFDLLGMNAEDLFSAIQVGQLYGNPTVKTSGTGQCRVKGLGAVGSRQDHHAGVALKAVHFRQQLIKGLLPLIIAAHSTGIPLLTNGIDLVDKDDTGRFFFGLLKQISYLTGTHTHEHLYELRAGD